MKRNLMSTITSLLLILLFAFHWVDDIVRGFSPGGVSGLGGILILVVLLYGTLVLGERRSGHIIMLIGSIGGVGVLVIHMRGRDLSAAGSPIPVESFSGCGRSSRSARPRPSPSSSRRADCGACAGASLGSPTPEYGMDRPTTEVIGADQVRPATAAR